MALIIMTGVACLLAGLIGGALIFGYVAGQEEAERKAQRARGLPGHIVTAWLGERSRVGEAVAGAIGEAGEGDLNEWMSLIDRRLIDDRQPVALRVAHPVPQPVVAPELKTPAIGDPYQQASVRVQVATLGQETVLHLPQNPPPALSYDVDLALEQPHLPAVQRLLDAEGKR